MAHMWFGDLVTTRWWNDLWLNETFATYMATLALVEATEFHEAWRGFSASKQWAAVQDQWSTTHPVSGPVRDTREASAIFDGITYGKGAAVMKQLSFLLGPQVFKKGVQKYLQAHSYGNAELRDFVAALDEASGQSLKDWFRQWAEEAGINTVHLEWSCRDEKLDRLDVIQSASPVLPTLRTHRTQIALYHLDKRQRPTLIRQIPVTYSGLKTSVPEAIGAACPQFIYPNDQDEDYAQFKLDPQSFAFLQAHLPQFEDSFLRGRLWALAWDAVRDLSLPVTDYIHWVITTLPKEREADLVQRVNATLGTALNYLATDDTENIRTKIGEELEDFFWKQTRRSPGGSDLQKAYWDRYVDVARTPESLTQLADALDLGTGLAGLKLDPDRRWKAIEQICSYDPAMGEPLREAELKKDTSRAAQLAAISSEAAQPLREVKDAWFNEISRNHSPRKLAELGAAMRSFFKRDQDNFKRHFQDKFFKGLPKVLENHEPEFNRVFGHSMLAVPCDEKSINRLARFIEDHPSLYAPVLKGLKEDKEELDRCARIRARVSESLKKH